ncbi:hypothetical protein Bca101_032388 [Brassica carinata]
MVLVVIMTLSPRLYRARCLVTPSFTDVLYDIQAYEAASFAQNRAFQSASANSHEAHQTAQHNNRGRGIVVLAQTEEEEVSLLVVVGFISKLQLLLATTLALHVRFVAEWSFSFEVLESF